MSRNLVHEVVIASLTDAANADSLSIARMHENGWQCIVKKGEFEVGESCIFIEIDAVLPADRPEFTFLTGGKKPFILKTIKLRGNLSQGLIIKRPMGLTDPLQEALGIKQRELREDFVMGELCGPIPSNLVSHTDRTRIQNAVHILPQLKGKTMVVTTKMDGTSSTFIKKDGKLSVYSHNYEVRESEKSIYWKIARKYDLENRLPDNIVIQGEICGPKVQKNRAKLHELTLFIFDAKSTEETSYFSWDKIVELGRNLEIPVVNYEVLTLSDELTVEELLNMADSEKVNGEYAEGIVLRSPTEEWDESLGRFTFKVISNNYLLKE